MKRRAFLKLLGSGTVFATAGAGVYAFGLEPGWLEATHYSLGEPGHERPVRFAQLSDLHIRNVGKIHHDISSWIARAGLDFVVITGDSVDTPRDTEHLDRFLQLLPPVPKYAILGNWEYWGKVDIVNLRRIYAEANCTLLVNESVTIALQGRAIRISGLDDLLGGKPDHHVFLPQQQERADLHVLLAHCPLSRDLGSAALLESDVDLVLSGHTHGGQVRVPGTAPFTPTGSGRYVAGWYSHGAGGPPLFVSRGVGTSLIPARLGSRPEITMMECGKLPPRGSHIS